MILGVDPGRGSGAAVLLSAHGEVRAWWTWCLLTRKGEEVWRVTSTEHAPRECVAVWDVACRIRWDACLLGAAGEVDLVVEGLFVPKLWPKKRHESWKQYEARARRTLSQQQAVLPLALAKGEVVGSLGMVPQHEPRADEWRPRQLSLRPSTPADEAEAVAVRLAPHAFTWPESEAPSTKAERGALAEAAFIARDGWVTLRPVHPRRSTTPTAAMQATPGSQAG